MSENPKCTIVGGQVGIYSEKGEAQNYNTE